MWFQKVSQSACSSIKNNSVYIEPSGITKWIVVHSFTSPLNKYCYNSVNNILCIEGKNETISDYIIYIKIIDIFLTALI